MHKEGAQIIKPLDKEFRNRTDVEGAEPNDS
jgi:hypothetical protein